MAFFGRFTERAQKHCYTPRKRPEHRAHYVGTEHLLLGLLREGGAAASPGGSGHGN